MINKVLAQERDPATTTVSEIMSSPLLTIDPDADLLEASQMMREQNVGKLVVMKGDILYGVVTDLTVTRYFGEYVERSIRDVFRWTRFLGR
jgi:CBS domain-containing protein